MCMSKCTRTHVDVEVRGQGVQVSSLPGDQLRLQCLYSQHFNPRSHLAGPRLFTFCTCTHI